MRQYVDASRALDRERSRDEDADHAPRGPDGDEEIAEASMLRAHGPLLPPHVGKAAHVVSMAQKSGALLDFERVDARFRVDRPPLIAVLPNGAWDTQNLEDVADEWGK